MSPQNSPRQPASDETVEEETRSIGRRLRARRNERGQTVREVALEAGLSLPYVANLENGRGNPTFDTLVRLARALDLPIGALVGSREGTLPEPPRRDPGLEAFVHSKRYRATCQRLATACGMPRAHMHDQLMTALAAVPRPPRRQLDERDWNRYLDAIFLSLTNP